MIMSLEHISLYIAIWMLYMDEGRTEYQSFEHRHCQVVHGDVEIFSTNDTAFRTQLIRFLQQSTRSFLKTAFYSSIYQHQALLTKTLVKSMHLAPHHMQGLLLLFRLTS